MPLSKIISESVDLTDNFDFTGQLLQNGAGIGGDNTPFFHAHNNSNPTWTLNTHTKIAFTVEDFDSDSAYDPSTSRFTVPSNKAGKYFIGSTTQLYGTSYFTEMFSRVYINGSAHNQIVSRVRYRDNDGLDANYNQNYFFGGIRALSVGDYIEIYAMVNGGSGNAVINQQSTFFAYKIIE